MSKAPRWLLLQHVEFEGPGAWADDLAEREVELERCALWTGADLPRAGDVGPGRAFEGVLVMGGPMSADDDARHPHLAAERALLADVVGRDVPVIGVCLGSQLLALALGAPLSHGSSPEFGLAPLDRTSGQMSPLRGHIALHSASAGTVGDGEETERADEGEGGAGGAERDGDRGLFAEVPVLHWHADAHGLPEGAERLASTAATPTQAFWQNRAIGMQFHVELRPEDLAVIEPHLPPELSLTAHDLARWQRPWAEVRARILDRLAV